MIQNRTITSALGGIQDIIYIINRRNEVKQFMWLADGWKDYEVIDCSKGEKLERWGDYLLVRPDPQVIWDTPKKHRGWKKMNGHYHRSSKGGGEWEFFDLPEQWTINYKELTFNLNLSALSIPVFSRNRLQTGTGLVTRSAKPDAL